MKMILLAAIFTVIVSPAYAADEDENIALTTYYPAPYGDYDSLETERLAVGSSAVPEEGVSATDVLYLNPVDGDSSNSGSAIYGITRKEGMVICDAGDSNIIKSYDSATSSFVPLGSGTTTTQEGYIKREWRNIGIMSMQSALTQCGNLGDGWRVPSLDEALSAHNFLSPGWPIWTTTVDISETAASGVVTVYTYGGGAGQPGNISSQRISVSGETAYIIREVVESE
jgi:hypothetical protein